ncbi:MAG: YfhO family protein [Bacteroidales bacterium]|nr:YfhO family protein [Clostridium sp.]MCM1204307.1 YfhO family protein [Bacteroidales bacterium]
MKDGKKRNQIWEFLTDKYVYTITFGVALLIMAGAWIVGEIGPFGGKSLVVVDGVHQYLPFFSEYQEKLKHLESMQYTFDVGLGNNFISLWSYYLSSPFNLIIILCSKSHLPMMLNLIISAKIILAALCFAYFLMHAGKKPVKNPGIIVFSLFYAFSSFVVGYYWNLMWLDCIFIFPIIILGMERLMVKKDSRMYILALLYSFICNYYISFMICLFLVLWFFAQHFRSFRDLFFKGLRFAVASLTAAALGAVVLVPAYKGIMTTASAKFELPEWEFYGSFADTLRSHLFCSEVMTNQVGDAGTNLYCGIFTILLAFMFFFSGRVRLEKKVKYGLLILFLVISFNNQQLNYIWHGFHNQYGIPNRFAFLYIFVLLIMAYEVYLKRRDIRFPMVVGAYLVSMLFVVYCYYHAETVYELRTYVLSAVILTVYLVLFALYLGIPERKKLPLYLLTAVAVLEVVVNGLFGFGQVGSSEPDYYYGATETFETLKNRVEEKEDGFFRADILEPLFVDEATWYNLKSVGIFGSTVRGELVDIMGRLGFYTGANEYLYYGATPVTNALFGVKYVYTREGDFVNVDMEPYDTEENISVHKNSYTLPVAYMVNQEILDFETLDNGPFTVQNELCGALSGVEPIFCSIYDDMKAEAYGTNVEVTMTDAYNVSYTKANGSARADMIYTVPYDMDLYVSCKGNNVHKIALLIDGDEVAFDRYQGQLFRVGKVKAGQLVDIQFVLNDGEDLSGDLYCYPMEFIEEQFLSFYRVLEDRGMQVEKFGNTRIEGKISVKEDGVLMTSIPYDEGWSIYANGEEMDACMLLDGFLGTELPEGDYTIKMVYRCPGLLKGFATTIMGIFFFWLICTVEKRQRRNDNLKREQRNFVEGGQ